ncbi:hypothetical protein BLNAU_22015 [Blattamonas nauphoetae]|uniref:Right handed beta helix domain-containing protein n=1 Tax=Blattamonas nauphoetae TaxID=2049346 RepID=A0ABQ9WUA8_9EUKA|nr:hypothetical protein BLNAU_22015 [Blattamonas nauphoetae]
MLFAVLFSALCALVDISTVLRSGSNSDTEVVLMQDDYFSRDQKIMDRWISLKTAPSSSIRGVLGEMRTLFDVINSTLLVGKVDICVDGDYRIAEMGKNSFISISGCTLNIGSKLSPFLSNGGDIILSWISLTGPSLLPEMVISPTHSCHLTVCGCTMDSVTVGSSAIFGCSSYTASITSSRFSNVDHFLPSSPLSHGPANTDPVGFDHFCKVRSSTGLQMNLASSSFWNVTDDLYGSITDAPISGKSFKLSHLHLRYSNTRRDLSSINTDYSVPYFCKVTLPVLIEDCHFADTSSLNAGALNVQSDSHLDITVQSCTFKNCGDRAISGSTALYIMISYVNLDDGTPPPHILVKDCSFVKGSGWWIGQILNFRGSIELNNLALKDCTPTYAELYVCGEPLGHTTTDEIVIKNCLFENCTAEKVDGEDATRLLGCCMVFHCGPVTVCDMTTFRNCKGVHYGLIFSCDSLTMKQVRFEECESTKSNGAGVIWTNKLDMEDVLVSNCRAPALPNGLLIRLSFEGQDSIPDVPNSEKSYEVKNCFIEHDDSGDFDHLDILFSIDASDLKDGRLDASKFSNLHSNADKFIDGVTTSGYSGKEDEVIPSFVDESATVAKKGSDPRSDAETEEPEDQPGDEPGDDPEKPKFPIWALTVVIVGSVVIVAAVIIIVVVVVVLNRRKKTKKVTDSIAPPANEMIGQETEVRDISDERSEP